MNNEVAEQAGRGSEDNGAGRYEPIGGGEESSMAERQGKVGLIYYGDRHGNELVIASQLCY